MNDTWVAVFLLFPLSLLFSDLILFAMQSTQYRLLIFLLCCLEKIGERLIGQRQLPHIAIPIKLLGGYNILCLLKPR